MFLHRVKMNWKNKYQRPMEIVLLVALVGIYLDVLGWAPVHYLVILKLTLGALAVTVALAFLKTLWDLWIAYFKELCTFAVAVRKFSRDYWSTTKNLAA
jgi:hypothetical protein